MKQSRCVRIARNLMLFAGLYCQAAFSNEHCDILDISVKINTSYPQNLSAKEEQGFGIIIGYRGDKYLVVTANHLIESNEAIGSPSIEYYKVKGKKFEGEVLQHRSRDKRRDIAFLSVDASEKYIPCWQYLSQSKQTVEDRISFLASGKTFKLSEATGNLKKVSENSLDFSGLPIIAGVSGSGLLGIGGLVGLITKKSDAVARATTMYFVKDFFHKNYESDGWKWGLTYLPKKLPRGELEIGLLDIDGNGYISLIGESGKAINLSTNVKRISLEEGNYSVKMDNIAYRKYYDCSPKNIIIKAHKTFHGRFRCDLDLEDTWGLSPNMDVKFKFTKNLLDEGYNIQISDKNGAPKGRGTMHIYNTKVSGSGDIRGFSSWYSLYNGRWEFETKLLTEKVMIGDLKYIRSQNPSVSITLKRMSE